MDKAARKKLNLKAIRRYDSAIVNILDQSPHAVLYYFSNEKREWLKKSVEGVLFLVQRNAPPYFAVYIMNRLAMENYTLYLTDFNSMDLHENFIIYSTSDGERYAFWLYEEGDRQRLLTKITTLHDGIRKELSAKSNQIPTANVQQQLHQHHLTMPVPPTMSHSSNQQQQQPITTATTATLMTTSTTTTTATSQPSGNAATDLLAMLQSGTPRHHPPNEYGPERTEQIKQQQQSLASLLHQSPAVLPSFSETPTKSHWTPQDHAPEFALPDAELLQPQSIESSGNRLLDLLKKPPATTIDQQQLSHGGSTSPGPFPSSQSQSQQPYYQQQQQQQQRRPQQHQQQQQQKENDGETSNGNRLLELLKKATVDDKIGHAPSPPLPPASLEYGTLPQHSQSQQQQQQQQQHLNFNQQYASRPPHPSTSSSTPNTMPPPLPHILYGKELTKPYQPQIPIMDLRRNPHQASPRNSASLLQALQGGLGGHSSSAFPSSSPGKTSAPAINRPNGSQQHGFPSASSVTALHGSPDPTRSTSTTRSSFSSASPLLPKQSLDLAQGEANKRFGGKQQKLLSKPEFIQQFLNTIQNDPTFFDSLYENYKNQKSINIDMTVAYGNQQKERVDQ